MKPSTEKTDQRARADGRRSLLVYLKEDVIKQLKIAALDEKRHAYLITEEALLGWLTRSARQKKQKARKRAGDGPLNRS